MGQAKQRRDAGQMPYQQQGYVSKSEKERVYQRLEQLSRTKAFHDSLRDKARGFFSQREWDLIQSLGKEAEERALGMGGQGNCMMIAYQFRELLKQNGFTDAIEFVGGGFSVRVNEHSAGSIEYTVFRSHNERLMNNAVQGTNMFTGHVWLSLTRQGIPIYLDPSAQNWMKQIRKLDQQDGINSGPATIDIPTVWVSMMMQYKNINFVGRAPFSRAGFFAYAPDEHTTRFAKNCIYKMIEQAKNDAEQVRKELGLGDHVHVMGFNGLGLVNIEK